MLISQGPVVKAPVYSAWMEREGDYLRASVEFLDGDGELTIEVVTKKYTDIGDGTVVTGTSIFIDGEGNDTNEWGDLKELVRYKMTAGGGAGRWVLFRMLEPVWFDAVDAS
ncbi:MAG: hypothetical protein H6828_06760 [Planctomycetes bacterium]|nr:hypothetical protein [Planctomycetota bacterium]